MYAIVETSGKQYKVAEKNVLDVAPLPAREGETISLSRVMMLSRDGKVLVGNPVVKGAEVRAVVVRHLLSRKVRGFKYKPKDNYSRRYGHRQPVTRIRIEQIRWPEEGVEV